MNEELDLFIEDVDEQLTLMEDALVSMQENGVNDESIGALFRAMHTIKGTAGMFGFNTIVSFAHIAENLLSDVREGKVILTPQMIETFLQAKDHTQNLTNLAVNNEVIDTQTQNKNDALLEVLKSMLPNANSKEVVKKEDRKMQVDEDDGSQKIWHISFRLKSNFFSSGMDIINILSFFSMLGEVKNTLCIDSKVPNLEKINPTESFIGYEVLFLSDSSHADIEEIFAFIINDVELEIFLADDVVMLEALCNKEEGLKEKLISAGFEFVEKIQKNTSDKEKNFTEEAVFVEERILTEEPCTIQKHVTQELPSIQEAQGITKKDISKNFSLRVDSNKIDQLINQISEMVIANAKVSQRADTLDDNELSESAIILSDMLEEIRTSVMNIRMVQVGDSFNKFKRIVNDVAKKVSKEIEFSIIGGETELDKMVVEKISDPLMHMLRNSIDHGIETPEERKSLGKSKKGNVTLKTYPDAGTIVIEISDDGRGLSRDKILAKAIASGLVNESNTLKDKEIYNLIFSAGLSTAEKVSSISGRGVGMDVVKRNIEALRGTVEIDSKAGEGSLFTIRLPLTLAIIDGFLVQSGNTKYIIPLEMIQECIELDASHKKEMDGNAYINLRDSILPLVDVRNYFNEEKTKSIRENIVVVRYGDYKIGMMVDELFGEFQTVIKPLGEVFSNVPGISGGTILGSGEIALIFDIPKLMEHKIREIK
ncbi:chemotaxis protein CheA [Sulfurimonas sp. SAG-AH-194-I05]|nr:chemotaxis protein CheA [Sulfurimonas sp. SAG-AH-194-I05]MDF1874209.1 chemotaxis protein CheA [Sulfurimonas sp. SAG-AH-194-I05]